MLDLQRQNSSSRNYAGAAYARAVSLGHLVCGLLAPVLLVFHGLLFPAMIVAFWYLLSIIMIVGMMNHHQWCRSLLSVWFFLAGGAGLVYVLMVEPVPALTAEGEPSPSPLPLNLLPFWLSTFALIYVAGGFTLLLSRRIERATMRGFRLWSEVRD